MAYKVCVYKNCDNYTYHGVPSGNKKFSLFRFPKDLMRYEEWTKRAEVLDGLPETQMWICSEHFDNKYIMKNCRRLLLTSTAVPFPYCEKISDDLRIEGNQIDIDNSRKDVNSTSFDKEADVIDTQMVFSIQGDLNGDTASIRLKDDTMNDISDDDDDDGVGMLDFLKENDNSNTEYCVASTTTTMKETEQQELAEIDGIEYAEVTDYEDDFEPDIVTQSAEKDNNSKANEAKKRKMNSEQTDDDEPSSSKIIASKITTISESQIESNAIANTKQRILKQDNMQSDTHNELRQRNKKHEAQQQPAESMQIDPETLVDTKSVTRFIFKGEEYVQMPKEYYVQEKMQLMQRLRKYENLLKLFKNNLLELDLS